MYPCKPESANILLIWGERFELIYQEDNISPLLIEKFKETTFDEIYFLTLFDRDDLFWESWKMFKIK